MQMIFDINEILKRNELNPNYVANKYGYKMFKSGNLTRVNSAPQKISFGDGEFFVSLIFDQSKLIRVVMMPFLEGVESPNYPDEEYELLKMNYCKNVLHGIYGRESVLKENGFQWKNEDYVIGCYCIKEGKDRYTGGNIIVDMR